MLTLGPGPAPAGRAGSGGAAAVLAAVHHAEVVALRVGEPFGTLILAIAVTVIEVGLILMLMTSSDQGAETLARDTVFSAFMIVCNGVVGLCLLVGALKHRVVAFRVEGVTAALATPPRSPRWPWCCPRSRSVHRAPLFLAVTP